MNASQRLQIFSLLSREITEPKTELKYRSHFQLLIAVILSAQATDISVNRATRPLFRDAPNPETIRDLGVEGLTPYIRAIGLFNTKAKNIISTCNILIEKYQSRVPRTRAALEGLPGVGRKTANVILNTAFGEPAIAVDTHIFRISNRTGLARGKTVLAVEKQLLKTTPENFLIDAHHLLILHGRYTCKARAPLCQNCVIKKLCEFPGKTELSG
ncbi:endonuclease III [Arenicellales bacterium IMCC55707]|jgi:endonuclease-3|nr:endonuclease III [Gammaproteobacteria bacterium]MCH1477656.1 endonuclease III [Arenicellales bacterium]MDC3279464.1 endonuclease III [Gammaproteobacteria bacterium]